jgi:hypothetical protein
MARVDSLKGVGGEMLTQILDRQLVGSVPFPVEAVAPKTPSSNIFQRRCDSHGFSSGIHSCLNVNRRECCHDRNLYNSIYSDHIVCYSLPEAIRLKGRGRI